ncbi:MAG: response regulator transcription factor [Acidimicrobiia bacterium]
MSAATDSSTGSNQATLRVVLVEDQPLFRDMLRSAIEDRLGLRVIGSYGEPDQALREIPLLKPDLAVLDISLGAHINGVELGVRLRRQMPRLAIVLLSSHADPTLLASLPPDVAHGWSYLLKGSVTDIDSLGRALMSAASGLLVLDPGLTSSTARGQNPLADLTARQREILQLVAAGYSNSGIAAKLILTEKSVENHLNRIYGALGIRSTERDAHPRVLAAKLLIEHSPA